ncbi:hypothetical protein ACEPPN_001686 [Leptodophora sp. 'Broadleaf-Isolate-01']
MAITTAEIAPIIMPTLAPVERPPLGDDIGKAVGRIVGIAEVGVGIVVAGAIEVAELVTEVLNAEDLGRTDVILVKERVALEDSVTGDNFVVLVELCFEDPPPPGSGIAEVKLR